MQDCSFSLRARKTVGPEYWGWGEVHGVLCGQKCNQAPYYTNFNINSEGLGVLYFKYEGHRGCGDLARQRHAKVEA